MLPSANYWLQEAFNEKITFRLQIPLLKQIMFHSCKTCAILNLPLFTESMTVKQAMQKWTAMHYKPFYSVKHNFGKCQHRLLNGAKHRWDVRKKRKARESDSEVRSQSSGRWSPQSKCTWCLQNTWDLVTLPWAQLLTRCTRLLSLRHPRSLNWINED